jgi:hypothetical protein
MRLGLVAFGGPLLHKPRYEKLLQLEIVEKHKNKKVPGLESHINYNSVKVTDFGQIFIDACVVEQHIGIATQMTESSDNAPS